MDYYPCPRRGRAAAPAVSQEVPTIATLGRLPRSPTTQQPTGSGQRYPEHGAPSFPRRKSGVIAASAAPPTGGRAAWTGARVAQRQRLGLCWAAKSLSRKNGARGSARRAPLPRPSLTRAPPLPTRARHHPRQCPPPHPLALGPGSPWPTKCPKLDFPTD